MAGSEQLSVHELAHLGEVGLRVDTHHRDLLAVGKKVLFLGAEYIVDLGNILGCCDQDQIGLDLF